MLSNEFTLTKRMLGVLLVIGGVAGFAAVLAVDLLQPERIGGVGPAQRIALGACVAIALAGVTLIPLGKEPA
jgi:hypothetical protein